MDVKKLEKRLYAFLGFVIFVFIVLTIGLSALQIVKGDEYEKLAEENRIRLISITAPRGVFKDRHGRELVNSRPSFTVSYMNVKTEESEQEEVFRILRDILKIPLHTEIQNQRYTVDKNKKIYLSQLPIADKNADGKINDKDIDILEESTGKVIYPESIDIRTGTIELKSAPVQKSLFLIIMTLLKNKIRNQGYKPVD